MRAGLVSWSELLRSFDPRRLTVASHPTYSGSFFGSQSQAMMPNASSDSAPTPAAM